MATRSDVIVDWTVSPRIITVQEPSTEITIQDLVDTLRNLEQEQVNLIYPSIVSAAGKENLGGGVSVGITATLLDAQVAFQARITAVETGTVTTGGTITFTDTTANFTAAAVVRGSLVVNDTDDSIADVLNVLTSTSLETFPLEGGIENDFDIGDVYRVFNIIQCNITGGNLVAVDALDADISPVLPTFGTQVVRTSSSSATLSTVALQKELQDLTYEGSIHIDTISGLPLTVPVADAFPLGTITDPVSNISDARLIANFLKLRKYVLVRGAITLDQAHDDWSIIGDSSQLDATLAFGGFSFNESTVFNLHVSGAVTGEVRLIECHTTGTISGPSFIEADNCALEGTISIADGGVALVLKCVLGAGVTNPILAFVGTSGTIHLHDYTGNVEFQGATAVGHVVHSIVKDSRVTLNANNTGGTILINGSGSLVDNSAGSTIVATNYFRQSDPAQTRKITTNKLTTNPANGVITILDDDDVTVFKSGTIHEDVAETQLYRGQGAEVRSRLT